MRRWRIYGSILIIPIFGGLAARLLRIVLAFTLRNMGLSVLEITILSSTFMLTRGLSAPIIGKLADKSISRLVIILIGFVGLGIDSILYLVVPYPYMIALRALDGLYGAMAWTTMQALVHLSSPIKFRGRLMSSYFMMGGLGASIGYIFYNLLLGNEYWAIITVAMFYLISVFFAIPLRDVKDEKVKKEEMSRMKRDFPSSLYTLNFFYGMFLSLGAEVLWFYLAENMGFGKYNTTLYLSIFTFVAIFGTFFMGHMADKKSYSYTLWLLALLSLISGTLLMLNSKIVVLIATLVFYISGRGFLPVARSFAASKTRTLGTSLGLVNMSSNIGSVLAPLIGGAMYDSLHPYRVFNLNMGAAIFFIMGLLITINTYILLHAKN